MPSSVIIWCSKKFLLVSDFKSRLPAESVIDTFLWRQCWHHQKGWHGLAKNAHWIARRSRSRDLTESSGIWGSRQSGYAVWCISLKRKVHCVWRQNTWQLCLASRRCSRGSRTGAAATAAHVTAVDGATWKLTAQQPATTMLTLRQRSSTMRPIFWHEPAGLLFCLEENFDWFY